MLTWHQPHYSTPWLQYLQKALLLLPWVGRKKEVDRDRDTREVVSIHKEITVTKMCVRVQDLLTGQRLGNENLPLKCCHGVSLQDKG